MTALAEAEARYAALLAKVADFWRRAVAAQPGAFSCRDRCAACCRQRLTVLPVEAAAIRAHLATLPRAARAAMREPTASPGDCAFLRDERCAVYPARPVICRTHGLAVRAEGRVDHCPLNFTGEPPAPEGVLSLDTINTLLVLVNRLWLEAQGRDPDAPREALADLAAEGPPA